MFGSSTAITGALKGRLYDLKQSRSGRPLRYDPSAPKFANIAKAVERWRFSSSAFSSWATTEPDTCEIFRNRTNTCVSLVEGGTAAKTIRVHHNLFLLDPCYNYALEAGYHNMEIDHNVFDGIEDITLLALSGVTGFRFVNNTVVVKKDMPVLSLGKHGKESRNILIADNLFVKEGGAPLAAEPIVFHADSPPAPDAATVRGNAFWNWKPFGADSRSEDPMLIREPDGDLLLKLSPASSTLRAGKGTPGGRPAE